MATAPRAFPKVDRHDVEASLYADDCQTQRESCDHRRRWLGNTRYLTPDRVFLVLSCLFGIALVFIVPPFQAPDEPHHFFRAYQVSELRFIAERQRGDAENRRSLAFPRDRVGGPLPSSLTLLQTTVNTDIPFHAQNKQDIDQLLASRSLPLAPAERQFTDFPNTALYTPIPYLPQAVGILLGRLCSLPPLFLFYLSRLCNVLCWVFLVTCAIRVIPLGKWTMCALALTPMSLFVAASVSADGMTNGLGFLFTALVMQSTVGTITLRLTKGRLAGLLVILLCLVLAKQAYLPMFLLLFLIPRSRFASLLKYSMFMVCSIMLAGVAWCAWTLTVTDLYVPIYPFSAPHAQIAFLLQSPLKWFEILAATYGRYAIVLCKNFIGVLGWLDTHFHQSVYRGYAVLLVLLALTDYPDNTRLVLSQRLLLLTTSVITITFISLLIYVSCVPPGNPIITGIQGRYFIPLSPCLFIALFTLYQRQKTDPGRMLVWLRCLVMITMLSGTVLLLITRYY